MQRVGRPLLANAARVLAAVLFLAGGAVHLDLWRGGYQGIPYIGPMFLANVIVSVAVALAIVVRRDRVVLFGGLLLAVGSLAALAMSRTVGLFGFMDGSSSGALRSVGAEVGAIVALALIVAIESAERRRPVPVPVRVRS